MPVAMSCALASPALASSAKQGIMPNLGWLLLAPALLATVLLVFAWERGRTKNGVPPTPLRLFASYLLMLPAFAAGSLCTVTFLASDKSQFHPKTLLIQACCGAVLVLVSFFYARRAVAVGRAHAARGGEAARHMGRAGRSAALAVVGTCALALATMYLIALG